MNPTPQQFTPAHFLSAARRAEAEGKADLAIQFYRHIVEQYGATPEAAEARDAFQRLGQNRKPETRSQLRGLATDSKEARVQPAAAPPPLSPAAAAAAAASPRPAAARDRPASAARPAPAARLEPEESPEFTQAYGIGRFLATLMGLVGALAIVAGLALGIVTTTDVLPDLAAQLEGVPKGWIPALIVSGSGVGLVFLSQLALALFDGANAVRELAAIERSKTGT